MANHPTRLCGPSATDFAEYLRQVRAVPLLTAPEEQRLARSLREGGCQEARERLVCANLRLVVFAARRYAGMGVPLADLVEAGNLGLLHAVGRFDPDRGARFSTYAMWWIRRSITLAISEHRSMIRVPRGQARAIRACRDAGQRIGANLGRPATTEELAREAGMTLSAARAFQVSSEGPSVVAGERGELTMGLLDDPRVAPPDEAVGQEELCRKLRSGLRSLPSLEAEIVRLQFGLGGRAALTLVDISRELGVPRATVARLLQAALRRLELVMGSDDGGPAEPRQTRLAAAG
jgi:RNA polymerase sigma factor (sigma-70 family)